jgi:hypothetical protein
MQQGYVPQYRGLSNDPFTGNKQEYLEKKVKGKNCTQVTKW